MGDLAKWNYNWSIHTYNYNLYFILMQGYVSNDLKPQIQKTKLWYSNLCIIQGFIIHFPSLD